MMTAADVLGFLDLVAAAGARVWVDGGWGVDACLGAQTRPHADLDIAIERRHLDAVTGALAALGYRPVPRPDTSPWNFVLGDGDGRVIDFHVITFDAEGDGVLGPAENGDVYPAGSLTGRGEIGGRAVDCVAAGWLVRFHTGYEVDADDWADVKALCERFGLPIPADYARWTLES
ncbi:MAG: aminoglycoside nucleotidyltransferase [Thermoactinospora sp.]|nr:aminoglycoside nucleotidyltransferase [Thermoactinospora sp.]